MPSIKIPFVVEYILSCRLLSLVYNVCVHS